MEPLNNRHPYSFRSSADDALPTRRGVLKLGMAAGASWLTGVAELLAQQPAPGERSAGETRAQSVILLWLEGGPSQLETFDPHPGSPIAGGTKAIATRVPGLQLAEDFEQLADQMQSVSLVRSIVTKEGDHTRGAYLAKTGYRPNPTAVHPSIGAICCHELAVGGTEIPRHISILPSSSAGRGGFLGSRYDAFRIGDPAQPVSDVAGWVDQERFQRRLGDLNVVDRAFERPRRTLLAVDQPRHTLKAARRIMSSEQLAAFEVSQEPRGVLRRYGDTPFGRGCLAARRLIEVGVRCVEVNLTGWDSHAENHKIQRRLVRTLDPAFAALLADLRERDALKRTVVLCAGEFGRTPRINALDGRDHWPNGFSVALAGGGIRGGLAVGETDPHGSRDVKDPHAYADIHATILTALGIDRGKENISRAGRPIRLSEGEPIKALLG